MLTLAFENRSRANFLGCPTEPQVDYDLAASYSNSLPFPLKVGKELAPMFWDIVTAVAACSAQFLTAWLGWRVTVDGVREGRKKLYESLFIAGGFVGALSIGVATYRSRGVANDLAELKAGQGKVSQRIDQIAKNTAQPPIVSIPKLTPSIIPKTSKGSLQLGPQFLQPQLAPNAPLTVNLYFTDNGQESISNVYHYGEVRLIDSKESPIGVHQEFLKNAKTEYTKQLKSKIPGTTVSIGQSIWNGPLGYPTITQEQYIKLKDGSLRFYVFGWGRWKDAVSDMDECVWLNVPSDDNLSQTNKLIWRDCIQPTLVPH